MKILILCNEDIASNYALNMLLPKLQQHQLTIRSSSRVGAKANNKPDALKWLTFLEQDMFNRILFPRLTTEKKNIEDSNALLNFQQLAAKYDASYETLNGINSETAIAKVNEIAPDVILSIRYGGILKDKVISVPTHGVLNLHSGKLPDYRGVMATFWALLNDESHIGTTLHYIQDAGIDTGGIISMSEMSVNHNQSYLWHVLGLYEEGVNLMVNAVEQIVNKTDRELSANVLLTTTPQSSEGSYYTFPDEAALNTFTEKGWLLATPSDILQLADKFS
ncbi:MAG: formyl transferase [Alteromonadaceae bacterium]|nr:formyl transferase [Alteromonadaceae bacterium]